MNDQENSSQQYPLTPPPQQGQNFQYPNQNIVPGPPNEGTAVVALVLGILGLTMCGILGPVAWVVGSKSRQKIRQSNGQLGGDGLAQAGVITGIIGTVLLALGFLWIILWFVIFGGAVLLGL